MAFLLNFSSPGSEQHTQQYNPLIVYLHLGRYQDTYFFFYSKFNFPGMFFGTVWRNVLQDSSISAFQNLINCLITPQRRYSSISHSLPTKPASFSNGILGQGSDLESIKRTDTENMSFPQGGRHHTGVWQLLSTRSGHCFPFRQLIFVLLRNFARFLLRIVD